jgi:O-antigen/teichoic acid export membrane protein
MRQSHLILSNALIIWASQVLQMVPQVILVPYLIRTIGEAGYGVYVLIWSLLMSVDQLEQSLQQGVIKYSIGVSTSASIPGRIL